MKIGLDLFQCLVKESRMLYPVRLLRGSKLLPRNPGQLPLLNQYIPVTVVATRMQKMAKNVLSHPITILIL